MPSAGTVAADESPPRLWRRCSRLAFPYAPRSLLWVVFSHRCLVNEDNLEDERVSISNFKTFNGPDHTFIFVLVMGNVFLLCLFPQASRPTQRVSAPTPQLVF